MALTYKELRALICQLTEAQLNLDVTIEIDDEFYPLDDVYLYPEEGCALDEGHPFLRADTDPETNGEGSWSYPEMAQKLGAGAGAGGNGDAD